MTLLQVIERRCMAANITLDTLISRTGIPRAYLENGELPITLAIEISREIGGIS